MSGYIVYQKMQVTSGIVIGIILIWESVAFHAIENTVANTIDATYAWHMLGKAGFTVEYMCGFMKTVSKDLHLSWAFFLSPKSTIYKFKGMSVSFVLLFFPHFLSFLLGLEAAFRSWESKCMWVSWHKLLTLFHKSSHIYNNGFPLFRLAVSCLVYYKIRY